MKIVKIAIATDHRGVEEKKLIMEELKDKYELIDKSPVNTPTDDYPDFALEVAKAVINKEADFGLLMCRTGIGMSIAANKVKGVRCAKVSDEYEAKMTRRDNNANVLALGAHMDIKKMYEIIDIFLNTEYMNIERYNRRLEKIDNYDS